MIKKRSFEDPSEKPTFPLEYQFAIFRELRRNKKLLRFFDKILIFQAILTAIALLRWFIVTYCK
jgi:hypothetical protein